MKESFKDDPHKFRHVEGDAAKSAMPEYDAKDFCMHARSISHLAELLCNLSSAMDVSQSSFQKHAASISFNLGENMLDEHFDLTAERIQELLVRAWQTMANGDRSAVSAVFAAQDFLACLQRERDSHS